MSRTLEHPDVIVQRICYKDPFQILEALVSQHEVEGLHDGYIDQVGFWNEKKGVDVGHGGYIVCFAGQSPEDISSEVTIDISGIYADEENSALPRDVGVIFETKDSL